MRKLHSDRYEHDMTAGKFLEFLHQRLQWDIFYPPVLVNRFLRAKGHKVRNSGTNYDTVTLVDVHGDGHVRSLPPAVTRALRAVGDTHTTSTDVAIALEAHI